MHSWRLRSVPIIQKLRVAFLKLARKYHILAAFLCSLVQFGSPLTLQFGSTLPSDREILWCLHLFVLPSLNWSSLCPLMWCCNVGRKKTPLACETKHQHELAVTCELRQYADLQKQKGPVRNLLFLILRKPQLFSPKLAESCRKSSKDNPPPRLLRYLEPPTGKP